ncbi:MAG TPA: alpha/beta hydrolase [Thermoanaerobaculia bacterium]|nr:alpha/beta hydrolase [Thermoanaerobaculia bacterium]
MRRLWPALLLVLSLRAVGEELWEPFVLRAFDGREAAGETRMIAVRENRRAADSRWIRIAVVRLRGTGKTPTIFLSGGPGIPATALARVPVYFDLFERLRTVGDVLLVDQRGSGMSVPNLTCPAEEIANDTFSSDERMRQALLRRVTRCAKLWRASGLDLSGYSTAEIAADVDAVRRAAGARKVNLLAFSYGSEVAFEIVRRWPASVQRIVFASTRAPGTLLKSPRVWDQQLDAIGVKDDVEKIVARLDREPIHLGSLTVGGIGLLTLLRGDLPEGRAIPNIPAFVKAVDSGDFSVLEKRLHQVLDSLGKSFNLMTLAVDCKSGWTPVRLDDTRREAASAVMRNVNLQWDPEICAALGGAGRPPAIGKITVPSLFITGTLDPNAPIAQTDRIRRHFTKSRHLIIEKGAHETLPAADVQNEVVRFLRD